MTTDTSLARLRYRIRSDLRRKLAAGLLALGAFGLAAPAQAILISLDLDSATAGIQSSRTVVAGTGFTADVILDTEGANVSFDGFEMGLDFATSLLSATNITTGADFTGFAPLEFFPAMLGLTPVPAATFSVSLIDLGTFGPVQFNGSGVLAQISFSASGDGVAPVSFRGTQLTIFNLATFATDAISANTSGADVTVQAVQSTVPEPAPFALFATGIALIIVSTRRRFFR